MKLKDRVVPGPEILAGKPIIRGKKPFQGYEELRAEELKDLRRMSLKESIRQTELLLREVGKWKR